MTDDEGCDDMAVVQAVLSGDQEAFRTLVSRYHAAVAALGRRILHSPTDCADFVQDVFLKAFVHLGQFSGSGRFYSWLIRIAYTTAINRLHRAIPEVPTDPDTLEQLWSDGRADNPQRRALRALLTDTVARAIRELPGHYALAVELFFFLDLRYREIAEMTGLPVNTIKSHVRRARLLLQRKLAGTIAEEYYDL